MGQIRIGVLGAYRGTSMINYCEQSSRARVVAICDKNPEALQRQKDQLNDPSVAWYDNFDSFIEHPMDAVVLANYANEHAPFAIRCLEKGLHVFSEVLPCQTMQEAVNLVEAVERSGKVYRLRRELLLHGRPPGDAAAVSGRGNWRIRIRRRRIHPQLRPHLALHHLRRT